MGEVNPLTKEFNFFIENQDDLVSKYSGKVVVIKNCEVIGVYDNELTAINQTKKIHAVGSFLVQVCKPGSDTFTQTYHSRVIVR